MKPGREIAPRSRTRNKLKLLAMKAPTAREKFRLRTWVRVDVSMHWSIQCGRRCARSRESHAPARESNEYERIRQVVEMTTFARTLSAARQKSSRIEAHHEGFQNRARPLHVNTRSERVSAVGGPSARRGRSQKWSYVAPHRATALLSRREMGRRHFFETLRKETLLTMALFQSLSENIES